eukprot:359003-Chlamydomonas_euryale.AAC.4
MAMWSAKQFVSRHTCMNAGRQAGTLAAHAHVQHECKQHSQPHCATVVSTSQSMTFLQGCSQA